LQSSSAMLLKRMPLLTRQVQLSSTASSTHDSITVVTNDPGVPINDPRPKRPPALSGERALVDHIRRSVCAPAIAECVRTHYADITPLIDVLHTYGGSDSIMVRKFLLATVADCLRALTHATDNGDSDIIAKWENVYTLLGVCADTQLLQPANMWINTSSNNAHASRHNPRDKHFLVDWVFPLLSRAPAQFVQHNIELLEFAYSNQLLASNTQTTIQTNTQTHMTKHANKHATSRHTVAPPDALMHSIFTHLLGATTQTDTHAAPSSSAAKSVLQASREQILSLIHSYVADRHIHLPTHTLRLLISTALTTAADTQFAVQVLDTVCTHTYKQAGNRVGEVTDRLRVCAQLFDAVVDQCLRQQQYEEAVSVIDLRNIHMSLPHALLQQRPNASTNTTNKQTHYEHTDTYTEPLTVYVIPRRFAAEFRACVYADKLSRSLAIAHTVATEQSPEHVFISEVVHIIVDKLLTSPNRHTNTHTTHQHTQRVYDVVNLCANIARWHQYSDRGREIVLQQVLPRVMDTIHTHSMNTHGQVDTQLQMIRTLFTPPSIQTDTTPTSQTTDAHSRHLDGLVQLLTSILNNKHTDTDITAYKDSAVMPYVLSVIDEQREPQMSVHRVLLAASHLAHTQMKKASIATEVIAPDALKQPLPMSALIGMDKYSKPPAIITRSVPTSRPNSDSLKRRKFDKKAIQYDEEGECDDKEIMGKRIALSLSTVALASSSTGANTQVSRRILDAIDDLIVHHADHLTSHYYSKNKVSNTSIARNNVQAQHRHPDVDSSVHPNDDVVASALLNNAVAIIWHRFQQQQQHQAANNDAHTREEAILARAGALEGMSEHIVKLLTTSLSMRGTLDTKLISDVINAIVVTVSTSTSTARPVAIDPIKCVPTFDKTAISLCGHVAQLLWLHNHANSRAFSEHPVLVQTAEHVAKMLASYVDGASTNPNTDKSCLMGAMSVMLDLEAATPLAVISHAQSQ
jgi:hypothetical protein